MRNWWIRIGCFLTGHNYIIVSNSSEVAAKAVKRYTSAMIIVCILWAFVGYSFTQRYLDGSTIESIIGAIVAMVIIVQIERQIILSVTHNFGLYLFRGCLAFMMALLGAAIIDQIILKKDIELEKISYVSNRVDSLLPSKAKELRNQIAELDSTIISKENELQTLIDDVSKKPVIKTVSSQTQTIPIHTSQTDSAGNIVSSVVMKPSTTVVVSNTPNPKQAIIISLDTTIGQMRALKSLKDQDLLRIRPNLENEVKQKVGFLDELKVMYILISGSPVAFCFWLLWLLFLLFIEMLVLFSKIGDKASDYEKTVMHQMNLQIRKLEVLSNISERVDSKRLS